MSRKKVKTFADPIYGFVYFYFQGEKDRRYLKQLLKDYQSTHSIDKNTTARAFYIENFTVDTAAYGNVHRFTGLWFSDKFYDLPPARQSAIIAHECYHLLETTLWNIGVGMTLGEYNEHMAYYLTFLVENYYSYLFPKV